MSTQDTPKGLTRSSLAFLSGTLLSRLTGLGRDVSMAFCFGSHPAVAAFMVAFRFANLVRRLLGEGPLPAGFIPHFIHLRMSSPEKGAQFFRDLFFSMLTLLYVLVVLGVIALAAIWKWADLSPEASQILYLTILMLPGVMFVCMFGLCSGLLQCEKKFFLTGFAPAAFNMVWMGAAWWLKGKDPSSSVVVLSLAIVVAFFFQWLSIVPQTFSFLKRYLSWKEMFRVDLFSSEMRQVVKPVLLGVVGVASTQINSALDGVFARFASLEGPAYLWYAIRLEQLPLALFGIALSAALFPSLSRAIREGMMENYLALLRFAYRRSFSLIFPCTMGIFVLGAVSVNLIYGRGDFTAFATYNTIICLWGYGLGLVPSVLILLLAPAFYAKKDYRTPMLGSVYSVLVNVAVSALCVFVLNWGAFSIAVATSFAAWVNYFYLSVHLARRTGKLWERSLSASFWKTGICTAIAAAVTVLVGVYVVKEPMLLYYFAQVSEEFPRSFSLQLLQFVTLTGTFGLILFSYAWVFNAKDLLELVGIRKKESAPVDLNMS